MFDHTEYIKEAHIQYGEQIAALEARPIVDVPEVLTELSDEFLEDVHIWNAIKTARGQNTANYYDKMRAACLHRQGSGTSRKRKPSNKHPRKVGVKVFRAKAIQVLDAFQEPIDRFCFELMVQDILDVAPVAVTVYAIGTEDREAVSKLKPVFIDRWNGDLVSIDRPAPPKKEFKMRVVAYVRASKAEQKITPQYQVDLIEKWCKDNDAELLSVHIDDGVSGSAEIENRPGMLNAITAVREEKADTFLVYRRDRFARDMRISTGTEFLLQKLGAKVVCADGSGNGESPEAQLMRNMLDAFAAYELLVIKLRTTAALQFKKSKGECIGKVPYGFRRKHDAKHSKQCLNRDGKECWGCLNIEPDPKEVKVIKAFKALRDSGLSWRNVATAAQEKGITNRVGKPFHFTHIRKIAIQKGL